jgi:hypothetical protein
MKSSRWTRKAAKSVTRRGPRVRLAVATVAVAAVAPIAMFAATASAHTAPGVITPAGSSWNSVVHVQPDGASWNDIVRVSPNGSSWN